MLHAVDREGAWFRVVDAAAALEGRGYGAEGELTLALAEDRLTPWNDGTWRLETSAEGGRVSRANGRADITLDAKALASLWCGRHSATRLAAWGFIEGEAAALTAADRVFATRHAPHSPDHF